MRLFYVRTFMRHFSRNTDAIIRYYRGFMHMQFKILVACCRVTFVMIFQIIFLKYKGSGNPFLMNTYKGRHNA